VAVTNKEIIQEALKNADKPLNAEKVGDLIRRLGYGMMHPKSLSSTLSVLVKNGDASVIPAKSSVSGRAEYFDGHINVGIFGGLAVEDKPVQGSTSKASDASSERHELPKQSAEVSYASPLAYAIVEAMHFVAGSSEFKAIQSLAKDAILSFAAAEPWKERGFIWVRCTDRNARLTDVPVTIHPKELVGSYRQSGKKLAQLSASNYAEILDPVIVRDRKLKSGAARIKNSYFMSTAVVWYLISNMPAEYMDNTVIMNFFEYVKGNYVDPTSGMDVVNIYTAINEAVTLRDQSVIAVQEESCSSEKNSENLMGNVIHLESQYCQILDATLANDGSLHFSLRIPRDFLNAILTAEHRASGLP